MYQDTNVKAITEIFLGENICIIIPDLVLNSDFLDVIPQTTKEKINQQLSSKLNTLCFKGHHQESKKTIQRMGEIFANHMSDKRFTSRI